MKDIDVLTFEDELAFEMDLLNKTPEELLALLRYFRKRENDVFKHVFERWEEVMEVF